jgi:hypothetical protein
MSNPVVIGEADNRLIGGVLGMALTEVLGGMNSAGVVGLARPRDTVNEWNGHVETFGQPVIAAVTGIVPETRAGDAQVASLGFLAGNDPKFNQPTGVYGESSHEGVVGISKRPAGTGLLGMANQVGKDFSPDNTGTGVLGSGYTLVSVGKPQPASPFWPGFSAERMLSPASFRATSGWKGA